MFFYHFKCKINNKYNKYQYKLYVHLKNHLYSRTNMIVVSSLREKPLTTQ